MIRVAVHYWENDPFSLMIYRENVLAYLPEDVIVLPFIGDESPDGSADLIWEPGLAGSRMPPDYLLRVRCPVVATIHGAAPFVLPFRENYASVLSGLRGLMENRKCLHRWNKVRKKISSVIAVSQYGAYEVASVFNLNQKIVQPIYHGVDHSVFFPGGDIESYTKPYFLLVCQYQPKKNVDRVLSAFESIESKSKPDLVAIIPGYKGRKSYPGVHIIREKMDQVALAKWYRGALAFVFPSLHETFGMPIIEAMACGCPVITSNSSACKEIAGEAAMLVDPRDEKSIATSIFQLSNYPDIAIDLREKGLKRAEQFTWQCSAEEHLAQFRKAIIKFQTGFSK